MSLPLSGQQILERIRAGLDVSYCDIIGMNQFQGQRGSEDRIAALMAWALNNSGDVEGGGGEVLLSGSLYKTDKFSPSFHVVDDAIVTSQEIAVRLPSGLVTYPAASTIIIDAVAAPWIAGTDFAIHAYPDGLYLNTSFISDGIAVVIGGFHYAPGGNATGTTGGNTTPAINPFSIWDLNFRPSCPDPRGMFLYAGREWIDIYLTNDNPDVYGTSAYLRPIADGSTSPIIPAFYGGNGSNRYGNLNWWTCSELAAAYGKTLISVETMVGATLGANQGTATVNDPTTTNLLVNGTASGLLTSRYGMIQSFGAMWIWCSTKGDASDQFALHGSFWDNSGSAGSRQVFWNLGAGDSYNTLGVRLRSDHHIS